MIIFVKKKPKFDGTTYYYDGKMNAIGMVNIIEDGSGTERLCELYDENLHFRAILHERNEDYIEIDRERIYDFDEIKRRVDIINYNSDINTVLTALD